VSNAVSDFFLNSGGNSTKFEVVGDTVSGIVISMELRQQTDMVSKQPAFWKDGSPKMQAVVTLQKDDGEITRIFCNKSMRNAIGDALRLSGATDLTGGRLQVTCVSRTPLPDGRYFANGYSSTFTAPVAADVDDSEIPF
jgi:hypothetical protein